MDNENNGITLKEIFKVIFKRVWWVVGVTAACLLIFVLGVEFVYNRSKEYYTANYSLDYPGISSDVFPDGVVDIANDLVTLDTLSKIKEQGGEKYASIDIEKMVKDSDIAITDVTVKRYDKDSYEIFVLPEYCIKVTAKYFKDKEQAESFVADIANYPLQHVSNVSSLDYSINLNLYGAAENYGEKIGYLEAQRNYIVSLYNELISMHNGFYAVGGVSLNDYVAKVNRLLPSTDVSQLSEQINSYHLVLDRAHYAEKIAPRVIQLNEQKVANNAKLQAIREEMTKLYGESNLNSEDMNAFNEAIVSIISGNSDIDRELSDIEKNLQAISESNAEWLQKCAEVESKLDEYYEKLVGATEEMSGVRTTVYVEDSKVTFMAEEDKRFRLDGGMSVVLAAIMGAIVGFVLSCVVIAIIDLPAYKRERKEQGESVQSPEEQIED